MTRVLQSSWVVSLIGCLLYLATTVLLIHPQQFAGAHPADAGVVNPGDDPSWRFRNPEFEQWVEELKREKQSLAFREQQLRELQIRLEAERNEIWSATQTVHQLQSEFDQNVVRFTQQEADNIKRQTKVISDMSPEGAAAMLAGMPDDEVVRFLFSLKADAAAQILDAMSKGGADGAKRAAQVSERMREVLPPPSSASRKASAG